MNDDDLAIFQTLGDIALDIQNTKLNDQQKIAANEAKKVIAHNNIIEKRRGEEMEIRKQFLVDEREENETAINTSLNNIEKYNLNAEEWSKLDDQLKDKGINTTEDGWKTLNDLGLEYGNNFQIRVQHDNRLISDIDKASNLIKVQRLIIDDLNLKENALTGLNKHLENVGTELGYKNMKNKEDIQAYIFENKEEFGVSPDTKFEDIDWAKDVNELARGFLKKKESPTDVGFWQDPTSLQMEAAGLSSDAATWGRPIEEVKDEKIELNLNQSFASIQKTINDIKTEHTGDEELSRKYSGWLEDLNLDNFMDLKGSGKLWDEGTGPLDLKAKLEQKIVQMVTEGTEPGFFEGFGLGGDKETKESVREYARIVPADDNPLTDYDESKNLISSQPLNRYNTVKLLHERWLGGGLDTGNVDDNGNPIIIHADKVEGMKGAGGLLNKTYAEDKMQVGKTNPGDEYGTTQEDLLLYEFMKMWKHIDNYHPTPVPDFMK